MQSRQRYAVVAAAIGFLTVSLSAQQPLARGQQYVLRVPLEALRLESVSGWTGATIFSGDVAVSESAVTVNGSSDWLAAGLPNDKPLTVRKVRTDRKTQQFEVELAGEGYGNPILKLRFASEAAAAQAMTRLFIAPYRAEDIAAFRDAGYAAVAKRTFTGPLADLKPEQQRSLLDAMRSVGAGKLAVETYKEKPYLSVDLGGGEFVFNTIQMKQPARVARRTTDALGFVKTLYKTLGACPAGLYGVKLRFRAAYKNFVSDSENGEDAVEEYMPCELIAKFLDADISSQALVNGSVVIVNGDRIELQLAQ